MAYSSSLGVISEVVWVMPFSYSNVPKRRFERKGTRFSPEKMRIWYSLESSG